jgi:O-phosphoseryl-tRNA synthetase
LLAIIHLYDFGEWFLSLARINPKEIRRKAEADFGKTWIETARLLEDNVKRKRDALPELETGKPHLVFETAYRLRTGFLAHGFMEVLNPVIVEEAEMFKQYGLEAPAILDRCYYLATLDRPDIGLSRDKISELKALGVILDEKMTSSLQIVLHRYKKGEIDGDDLIEKISEALNVDDVVAMSIMERVFPAVKHMTPTPTRLTLRSHMTTAWFLTLSSIQGKVKLPVRLFSVDVRFRREQQEDATHLKTHRAASAVIMSEDVCLDDGKLLVEAVLGELGFKSFEFRPKPVAAKYYAPRSEIEVFVPKPTESGGMVEVADFGLYAPTALANYDIEYPVLNIGIGVERVAMILYGYDDVRKLAYPQFYEQLKISDRELATMVRINKIPMTQEGKRLSKQIIRVALENKDAGSPCSFIVFDGPLIGKRVKVEIYENDPGVKLIGPAALNSIYVYKGEVVGIPEEEFKKGSSLPIGQIKEHGVSTGITYLDAIASLASRKIEEVISAGEGDVDVRVKIAKLLSDVNLSLDEVGQRYITDNKARIDVRGPVFVGVKAKIMRS